MWDNMQIMEVESIEAYLLSFIEWLNVKRVFSNLSLKSEEIVTIVKKK